jgi:uncharacterized alkaline shock family protein YloU
MENNGYRQNGNLKISEEVISTIAGLTTSEIKGVAGMLLRPVSSDFKLGFFGNKRSIGKAIHVEVRDGEVIINIFVNLYIGTKIPETASEIQLRVKEAVQNMTGLSVAKVNVHVSGIIIDQTETETEV